MTHANKITVTRLLLVPVFAVLATRYGESWKEGNPQESLRWLAIGTYIIAAASDGLDGWLARRFNQRSLFGAMLDPLTDKALLLTGLITLTFVEWGNDWHLPIWFITLVIAREVLILGGIIILYIINRNVPIKPHWTGKICTITQLTALGWIMLKLFDISPIYPTLLATIFTIWSAYAYFCTGVSQLPKNQQKG